MTQAGAAPVIVTSPHLAREATEMLRRHEIEGRMLVWQQGSAAQLREALSTTLLSTAAPLCISFYNDYIFCREEIAAFPCVVNIHPALPNLRGRGYDTLPILEGHRNYGATLHIVNEDIDSGQIIKVISRPMPQAVRYPAFRRMTQRLSLELLETLLQRGRRTGLATLTSELRHQALRSGLQWSGERLNSRQLAALLRDAARRHPRHPLFAQLPARLWT